MHNFLKNLISINLKFNLSVGPAIQVCKDDTIVVNVENNLHSFEATTIHWYCILFYKIT